MPRDHYPDKKPVAIGQVNVVLRSDGEAVYMVIRSQVGEIALIFRTPEQLLDFTNSMIDEGSKVWPKHPMFVFYKEASDEEGQGGSDLEGTDRRL